MIFTLRGIAKALIRSAHANERTADALERAYPPVAERPTGTRPTATRVNHQAMALRQQVIKGLIDQGFTRDQALEKLAQAKSATDTLTMSVKTITLPVTGLTFDFRREPTMLSDEDAALARINGVPARITKPDRRRKLRLSQLAVKGTLHWTLKQYEDGEDTFLGVLYHYCRDRDDRIPMFLNTWMGLSRSAQARTTLDEQIEQAGLRVSDVYGWFASACFENNISHAKMLFADGLGDVVKASLARARDVENGTEERKVVFQTVGLLSSSKGIQIGIQQNVTQPDERDGRTTFSREQRDTTGALRGPDLVPALPAPVDDEAIDV